MARQRVLPLSSSSRLSLGCRDVMVALLLLPSFPSCLSSLVSPFLCFPVAQPTTPASRLACCKREIRAATLEQHQPSFLRLHLYIH